MSDKGWINPEDCKKFVRILNEALDRANKIAAYNARNCAANGFTEDDKLKAVYSVGFADALREVEFCLSFQDSDGVIYPMKNKIDVTEY